MPSLTRRERERERERRGSKGRGGKDLFMKSRRCDSAGAGALSSDGLLKIFSLLSPRSLARSCLVCTSWNKIITRSALWKSIYDEARNSVLHLSTNTDSSVTKRIFLSGELPEVTDWKAQYVKEYHKFLFVHGFVNVKEWKGHSKRVECAQLHMETIVTGSSDGVVHSWSSTTSECLATYVVPNKARIMDLEFDETKILAVSGTEIYVWGRKKGKVLRHFQGHNHSIHSMCYADPEVLVGCSDGSIRIFDIYSGRCTRIFRHHDDRVTCIVVDNVTSCLMSGSADGSVKVCGSTTGEGLGCLLLSSPPIEILCLHLVQQENILVGGTSTGHVHAWDSRKHSLIWSVRAIPNSITSMHAPFYDASILVVGSIIGMIAILDTASGAILRQLVAIPRGAAKSKQDKVGMAGTSSLAVAEHSSATMGSSLEASSRRSRPPILCLKAGMTKIVTTHADGTIRVWGFEL